MHTPALSACTAFHEYMLEDGNLFEKIRMDFEWDEHAFQRLVQASTRCLEEIARDDMIPRYVATFFGNWLHIMMGMMQHPNFLRLNRGPRTEQENTVYFDERIAIMKKLVHWMSSGPRPYPATDFILPGWESPIAEAASDALDTEAPALAREATPTHPPERSAYTALREHLRGDGRRFEPPRVRLEWDDAAFRTLVQLTTKCLEELEHDEMIPRHVASFIGHRLQDFEHTLGDPRFLALHLGGRTEQEARAYFDRRIELIQKLVSWMSNGKRQHPAEQFVLPEWKSANEP